MPTYLSPKSDITFKKVFGNKHLKDVTISFLNSILQLRNTKEIKEITFVDTENVRETVTAKDSFIDVHCIDGDGHHFLIEMQVDSQAWFIQRALYYLSWVFSGQLPSGINYDRLVPVICITILDHIKFKQHKNVISHYIFKEKESGEPLPEQYLELYFIELPKFTKTEDELESDIDEWLFFMTSAQKVQSIPQKMKHSKEFKDAFHVLDKMKWTDIEFKAYLGQLDKADRPRRIEAAIIQEAEENAVQKEKEKTAFNLLKMGLTIHAIAQVTGLSVDQIKIVKNKITT